MTKQHGRSGVLAAGNFIVDHIKAIDAWPDQDMLATISSEAKSSGGGPYNVLKDLAALGGVFPLEAAGIVGDDDDGRWIRSDCLAHGIDVSQLHSLHAAATAYTDVMCVERDGHRTFFHNPGANSLFSLEYVDPGTSTARVFLLAYLLLLEAMDQIDDSGRTEASRLLEQARGIGFLTAVDTVSTVDPAFRDVVIASLAHTDFFFLNEVEASLVLGRNVDPTRASLREAAGAIYDLGSTGHVIVHCARGAVCREPDGAYVVQPSVKMPSNRIEGSTGAGDAFTAGFLHGIHEQAGTTSSLLRGVCAAAQSLTHPTASGGMAPVGDCLRLGERYGFGGF